MKKSKQPRYLQSADSASGVTAQEMDVRREERQRAAALLESGRTPLQLVAVAEQAVSVADRAVGDAMASTPPRVASACKEGCAWCCHQVVGTVAPEVFRIVSFLRETLPAVELQALRERAIRLTDQRRSLRLEKWAGARLPCPLLVENRCAAYAVRPLTCRGCNSSDARRCEQSVASRTRVDIPNYSPQQRLCTFVLDGLCAGLDEVGLKGELLDLTAALGIALTQEDAAERWLAGQPTFAPARLPLVATVRDHPVR